MKSKSLYTTVLLTITISLSVFSQQKSDFMGFPYDENFVESNPIAIGYNKNTQTLESMAVERNFKSPVSLPSGIAYDGQYLWVCGYNEYFIYQISTIDGSTINKVPVNLQKPYGITFSNDTIYLIDNNSKNIFAFDPATGNCLDTIIINHNLIYPTGLYKMNDEFIFNDTKGPQPNATGDSTFFYNYNTNTIIGNHAFGTYCTGITFDGTFLWINDNPSQSTMKIDPQTWTLINSYKVPGGMYPNGIAYDGQYLWEINNASDSIYMLNPNNVTTINNNSTAGTLNVFPNPVNSNENFNILLSNRTANNITISDATGKIILNKTIAQNSSLITLNANDLQLSSGVYTIRCQNYSAKFIVK